jgi:putative salt-induced outer membrane protein YdiY
MIRIFALRRMSRISLFAILSAGLCYQAQGQMKRKDVVIMNNGDRFTGEVKRLQDGLLYVETNYVATSIGLDWNQVESVQTTATYQITLTNGKRLVGKIEKVSGDKSKQEDFLIKEAASEVQVTSASIVSIDTKKPTFWRELRGSMDLGSSFTSGNNQLTMNADASVAYRTPGWEVTSAFDSTFSGQSGASKTNRQDVQSTLSKFLSRDSFLLGYSDFLHSSQQDLNLRTTLGGGYGRYLIHTTASDLSWIGGFVYINESFDSVGKPSNQNAEAMVGLQYNLVRFNFGDFNSQLLTFPGLSDVGRVRLTTNNSLTIRLRNNFHLAFTFWDNFDSKPPVTARKNELGISSGIGWSF